MNLNVLVEWVCQRCGVIFSQALRRCEFCGGEILSREKEKKERQP